ncbi:Hypothetical protein HVR_LOCUS91 [uncultured virus]|nr:Hypothetical protein HVR_LOCUS91 [uncultured virus]
MVEPIKNQIINGLETNFKIQKRKGDREIYFDDYHVTALKLIEIIFNTIKPAVDSQINEEWINNFLPPLSTEIDNLMTEKQ